VSHVKARVEHPFHIVKNLFGHRKTCYRDTAKNESQSRVLFALANVYMTRKKVMWGSGMSHQRQCAQKSTQNLNPVLFRHIEHDS
jgi:hypothetical protein